MIGFAPTYKYKEGSDDFNKKRAPAWCDRVVFKAAPGIEVELNEYDSHALKRTSDHRPVAAQFHVVPPVRPATAAAPQPLPVPAAFASPAGRQQPPGGISLGPTAGRASTASHAESPSEPIPLPDAAPAPIPLPDGPATSAVGEDWPPWPLGDSLVGSSPAGGSRGAAAEKPWLQQAEASPWPYPSPWSATSLADSAWPPAVVDNHFSAAGTSAPPADSSVWPPTSPAMRKTPSASGYPDSGFPVPSSASSPWDAQSPALAPPTQPPTL